MTSGPEHKPVLDEDTLRLFAEAQKPVDLSPESMERMRARILTGIEQPARRESCDALTIRRNEGDWVELMPKVEIKQLYIDRVMGTRSFLMRLHAGAQWPAHPHTQSEECLVLEGEVSIGELTVCAGDYHLAPSGITHGTLHSGPGALLFLRAGLADTEPTTGMKFSYLMRKVTRFLRASS